MAATRPFITGSADARGQLISFGGATGLLLGHDGSFCFFWQARPASWLAAFLAGVGFLAGAAALLGGWRRRRRIRALVLLARATWSVRIRASSARRRSAASPRASGGAS